MKKLLFGILFLSITHLSFSQTSSGNKMVGLDGNLSLVFVDNSDDLFNLNLNPNYGVFIQDNLAVGGALGINYQSLSGTSSTAFSLLPFARYYFAEPDTYQFFVEAALGLYLQGQKNSFGSDNETALRYQFGPGMAFFLSDHVSFDLQLLFDRIGGNFDNSQLGVFFGFQVFLDGSKE